MVLPVVAIRSAVKAMRGLSALSSINDARKTASIFVWLQSVTFSSSVIERCKIAFDHSSVIFETDSASTAKFLVNRNLSILGTSLSIMMRS